MSETMEQQNSQEWKPSINPWLAVAPVMLAIFMFVLDETISNVALIYIAGSMSVSHNESTWVLTSYLIASGIAIPLAGMMAKVMGRKQYFIVCIIIFTISSFLCAVARSMPEIVLFRFIQGLGGGGLLPLGQSIMLESFSKEDRPKSMAMFGVVIVFAPLLGPVLGGWITENWSWPWIYLINIPIGIMCTILAKKLLEDPPYAKKQEGIKIDVKGLTYLSLWLISLQVVLDKGNDADWFGAAWICWLSAFSVICAVLFFISQFKNKEYPLIDLGILKKQNVLFRHAYSGYFDGSIPCFRRTFAVHAADTFRLQRLFKRSFNGYTRYRKYKRGNHLPYIIKTPRRQAHYNDWSYTARVWQLVFRHD